MSEKKKPEIKKNVENEEPEKFLSETVIEALWNQYDFLITSVRTSINENSEAYEHAIKETKKFFKEYKKMMDGFRNEQSNINKELLERFSTYQKNKLEQFDSKNEKSEQLDEQLKEIRQQYEKIAEMPWEAWDKGTERVSERIESNVKHSLDFMKKNRETWETISDNYAKALKDSQQAWVKAGEKYIVSLYKPFFRPAVQKAE